MSHLAGRLFFELVTGASPFDDENMTDFLENIQYLGLDEKVLKRMTYTEETVGLVDSCLDYSFQWEGFNPDDLIE
jgi:hypothetical protein